MKYPAHYRYTREHEWIFVEGDIGTVGITDYAQDQLGDVVYVELPEIGRTFQQMDIFGTIESVKTAADLYIPVSGEVVAINEDVIDHPEIVNASPHDRGWLIKIRLADPKELDTLLSAEEYEQYVAQL